MIGKTMTKKMVLGLACLALLGGGMVTARAAVPGPIPDPSEVQDSLASRETIDASRLSNAWDKVFPENPAVAHHKVVFYNRYGITLVADQYTPKNLKPGEKLPAIALAGPYGAVKEQVSGRYARELAARGFLTIAFDPSFTGESAGEPSDVSQSHLG